jgi:hypothetical protein
MFKIGFVVIRFSVFSQLYKSGTQVKFLLNVSIGQNKFIIKIRCEMFVFTDSIYDSVINNADRVQIV